MVKVLEEKYPMGSIKGQQTPGRYMDGFLKANIDILAEKIEDDMTFLGLISSSTLEVRTGKSSLVQQIGEYYTEAVNKMHGTNLTFTKDNLVFKAQDLIDRAFKLPRYSCLILDEGDDLDAAYYSKLAMQMRRFFRKSGQLNLFILVILPNFFQIPAAIAINRSIFFIDVQFKEKFQRGYFAFYNFKSKRELYVKGKKTYDYSVVRPDFVGQFTQGYGIPEAEYREAKFKDMMNDAETKHIKPQVNETEVKARLLTKIVRNIQKKHPEITKLELAGVAEISKKTLFEYLNMIEKPHVEVSNQATQL